MSGNDETIYVDEPDRHPKQSHRQSAHHEQPRGQNVYEYNHATCSSDYRGRGGAMNYTDVIALLLSLRREHPNAEIVTEHIRIEDGFAVFKATISIPGGGKA